MKSITLSHENIASRFPEKHFALDEVRNSNGNLVFVKTKGSCLTHVAALSPFAQTPCGWGAGWCEDTPEEHEFVPVVNA